MQSDDDFQTTLTKWPFILGDALLVGAALAIAILGNWQLTNWQVASCVISVALGAGLYVLPFLVEYRVRVREEAEDRSADLRSLRRQLAGTEAEIEALNERLQAVVSGVEAMDKKTSVSKPTRAPRKRRTVEPRLWQRAIDQKQDSASQAVSRIIGGQPKKKPESAPETAETEPAETEPAETMTAETAKAETAEKETGEGETAKTETDPEPGDAPERSAPQEAATEKSEPAPANADPGQNGPVEPAAQEPPVTPDMFADSVPREVAKQRRTKKRDTAVIASIFIGIGNKPYLRGSGGGLNWERGVAMEFEEIGKWRWLAPENLDGPIELQVYRNDADPDATGKHVLDPGQQLEIAPDFQA